MTPKILFIDRSSSVCGVCGKGAAPSEKTHYTVLEYTVRGYGTPNKGCGAKWTHVSSNYIGDGIEENCKRLRPDLIWIEQFEARNHLQKKWDIPDHGAEVWYSAFPDGPAVLKLEPR